MVKYREQWYIRHHPDDPKSKWVKVTHKQRLKGIWIAFFLTMLIFFTGIFIFDFTLNYFLSYFLP